MLKEDALLDDDPIEFKGGRLTLNTDELSKETTHINNKIHECPVMLPWAGEDPKSFFCYRDDLVTNAMTDIKQFLSNFQDDNDIHGIWLLTEISFWDNERERVVVLTKDFLIVVKYDFIALKILSHFKIPLHNIDTLTVGDLVYPSGSLAPHINGITSGVMHVLKSCALKVARNNVINFNFPQSINETFSITYFKARSRNITGVRPMWNKGEPLKFSTKWNPFANNIPWVTLTSHPLLWHRNCDDEHSRMYDVDNFVSRLIKAVQQTPRPSLCHIQLKPILLQNYFGVLSIIHNRNGLGFFKVRGKFSF